MASRRSLTTTTAAAGGLLAALCFVPSASATVEHPSPARQDVTHHKSAPRNGTLGEPKAPTDAMNLADTGSVNTTPYVVCGTGFLVAGAALLVVSRRRGVSLSTG
ncbi:LAETG motif-containing sortase-dependent surface protein [Streptantibioticus ferralitis]|uniref:LAETG motif-containing sortase-dependent surface protein n=1 Tax=Streptantibioticus ferralitis TaxID=236510 RepID=A0ABT5Z223_9ACTN|nr:LAETG motif-containing sortase-dependent surface protein [Streptantibioticus ferralitis]MDF2257818.1 LAETG motif-containing sortase-dependent surface protein [Streptantibioticus ferralitis]